MNSVVLNEKDISRAITRITHEILEKNKGAENVAIVGIRTRGVTLAKRIHKKINEIEGIEVDFGSFRYNIVSRRSSNRETKSNCRKNTSPFSP